MLTAERYPPPPIWAVPTALPTLGPADVHVWRAALDLPLASLVPLEATLSPDERERAARYCFPLHRERWVAARGILRQILAGYLPIDPALLRFDYGAFGKPSVRDEGGDAGLCFSLSHGDGLAIYAITLGRRIGIDIEALRSGIDVDGIAARHFSAAEARALGAQPPSQRPEAFFRCWTRKEAYIKALGLGLSRPLDRFTVSVGQVPALLSDADDPCAPGQWSLHSPEPGRGYVAALAVQTHRCSPAYWRWRPDA